MKMLALTLILAGSALPGSVLAADPRTGTWKYVSGNSAISPTRDFMIEAAPSGYTITDPGGKRATAQLDGKDYPVPNDPDTDETSMKRGAGQSLEVSLKKGGKLLVILVLTASGNGKEVALRQGNTSEIWTRVGGSSDRDPLSGTWTLDEERSYPGAVMKFQPVGENGVQSTWQDGSQCTAEFDGQEHQCAGAGNPETITLKMIDARTVEELRKGRGFGMETARFVVSPDDRRLTITRDALRPGGSHYHSERVRIRLACHGATLFRE
jgi:hypothetical protein